MEKSKISKDNNEEISKINEKSHKCKFCEKRFSSKKKLTIHERIHTVEKSYECRFCEKKFTVGRYCKMHERTHVGEKNFQCSACGKSFTSSRNLKIHQKTHNSLAEIFKCYQCEK